MGVFDTKVLLEIARVAAERTQIEASVVREEIF